MIEIQTIVRRFDVNQVYSVVVAIAMLCTSGAVGGATAESSVNVYSFREPKLTEPLFKAFADATGIKVNVVFASSGLVERMKAEGRNSPADVLLTNEFSLLIHARAADVIQPLVSPVLAAAVPSSLRDPDGYWFGLTRRARVIYASRARVQQAAISYEELADPKWKGKICSRSGQHAYNVSMFAAMIAHLGEDKAEAWLRGVKQNLARKPAGGDREQVRDVNAGLCDIAIGNTYYMGLLQTNTKSPEQQQWAAGVKILFPNAQDRGTHVNISGMSLAANAPNKANGVKLMEYLASGAAQKIYAEVNHEYPVVSGVEASEMVRGWGQLKPDSLPLAEIAKLRRKASELVDKVNFDGGPGS